VWDWETGLWETDPLTRQRRRDKEGERGIGGDIMADAKTML